ncbi:MAG: hypothetical protein CM1200mP41_22540 [Gammaproteobacteria bacterium]|nr:MAG: hypothetical protein CM1200mP41_22540 [Gammaproteobacteria bacterium]
MDAAQKDKQIRLIANEQEREEAEIERQTVITAREESARLERSKVAEQAEIAISQEKLKTRLALLELINRMPFPPPLRRKTLRKLRLPC